MRYFPNQLPWEWWKNMTRAPSLRFCKYFGHFHMLTFKARSETVLFRERDLSKFFTVGHFSNILAITIMFCFNYFKIWCKFQKWNKEFWKCFFYFSDSCIWIGSGRILQSWRKYLPAAVNVLRNTRKISPNTRGDNFDINFPENYKKTGQKSSHGDFASIWNGFPSWM